LQNNLTATLPRFAFALRLTLLALLALAVGAAWWYARTGSFSPDLIGKYRIEHPSRAAAMFLLIYALSVLACLPTIPLNLGAGYLWGGLLGGAYSALGVTAGGLVAFVVVRAFAGKRLELEVNNRALAAILREFHASDWRLVAFVRLNPIFPTGPVNYLLGLTALRHRTFAWSTFLFLLPPSIAVAYIGDSLQTFAANQPGVSDYLRNMLIISAAITALAGIKVAGRFFGKPREKS
jgi:uncharacterized membrane protein YdjX (TVP38/TMEM64 family)